MRQEFYSKPNREQQGADGLRLCFCGWESCESGHRFGPAVRQQYLLHFVVGGKGTYRVGDAVYTLQEGEAFLIRPGESTIYEADAEEPWEYMWLAFEGYGAGDLLRRIGLEEGGYILRIRDLNRFSASMKRLIRTFENERSNPYELLGCFYLVMAQLPCGRPEIPGGSAHAYYKKAAAYIRQNYGYPIKISDVAKFVGVNRTYLYKIFMEAGGVSPKEYLLAVRLEAARSMLDAGRYTVTETAYSCGFRDAAAFCNYFKRAEGCTPRAYARRQNG